MKIKNIVLSFVILQSFCMTQDGQAATATIASEDDLKIAHGSMAFTSKYTEINTADEIPLALVEKTVGWNAKPSFKNEDVAMLLRSHQSHTSVSNMLLAHETFELAKAAPMCLKVAANYGHPIAQYQYAMQVIYDKPQDSKEFLFRSAALAYPEALYELSVIFRSAPYLLRLETNDVLSLHLCEEAANLGHERAQFDLVSSGKGVNGINIDGIKALASKGNTIAKKAVEAYESLDEETRDEASDD